MSPGTAPTKSCPRCRASVPSSVPTCLCGHDFRSGAAKVAAPGARRAPEWITAIVVLGVLIVWRSWHIGLAFVAGASAPGIASEKAAIHGLALGEALVNGVIVAALSVALWICIKRTPGWWTNSDRGLALAGGLFALGFLAIPFASYLHPAPYRATDAEMREGAARTLRDQSEHPENYRYVRDPETGGQFIEPK